MYLFKNPDIALPPLLLVAVCLVWINLLLLQSINSFLNELIMHWLSLHHRTGIYTSKLLHHLLLDLREAGDLLHEHHFSTCLVLLLPRGGETKEEREA